MAGTSFTLSGDKEVSRQLRAVSDAVRGQALKRALVSGALLIVNEAKTSSPYLTGNLRRSLHVGGRNGGLEGDTTGTDIGGEVVGRDYAEVLVGTNVEYAIYQEFGTSKMPAHPYLRPAIESTRGEVQREIVDSLRILLRKAVG